MRNTTPIGFAVATMAKMTAIAAAIILCNGCVKSTDTIVGNIDIYENFASKYVEARTVRVWTPEGYDKSQKYDVIYMHDGQNLFDSSITWNHQEWGVDEAMDSLIRQNKIKPCIVVGMDCIDKVRFEEYYPSQICADIPEGILPEGFKPLGDEYLKFLVEEVKPFIDSTYSTWKDAEHTFVMGSSCGGLISSYALCRYPDVFSGAACLSTHSSLWNPYTKVDQKPAAQTYLQYLKANLPMDGTHKLYMDRGDCPIDIEYSESQAEINSMIDSLGCNSEHYKYIYFPGTSHCENDWRSRLENPLLFLLKKD